MAKRRCEISDANWQRIEHLLPGKASDPGRTAEDNRRFVNAVLWIGRTGAPWRDLPSGMATGTRSSNASTAGPRRASGSASSKPCRKSLTWSGSWSTRRRCAPTSTPPVKKSCADEEALGRSRGGFTTKIHAAVDAVGNPLGFVLTPGQRADITQAEALVEPYKMEAVIADKGYDSDAFVAFIKAREAEAVIPPKRNRKEPRRSYDENLYADRNKVERLFNRLKHYRRVATRYEKTARNYLSFVYLASTMIWLL